MAERPQWNSEYEGTPPWDIGHPQAPFVALAEAGRLNGRTLDVGCGTGEHVLLAAEHGAEAMGVDISDLAIRRAGEKAKARGLSVILQVGDVLHLADLGRQFDAITDCGVFHVFAEAERAVFVQSLKSALRPGGIYYMMCFSDLQPGDWGPRRVSQDELRTAFADGWSVESIEPARLEVNVDPNGAQAWLSTITRLPD
ncbi:MAG: class I SAM-dependent methyltransferase [Candidatus Dormibacteria bacterium]